jgi:hypothetical protein
MSVDILAAAKKAAPEDPERQQLLHDILGYACSESQEFGEWEEGKHPRAKGGQFGKGSGGSKAPAEKKASAAPEKKASASRMAKLIGGAKALHEGAQRIKARLGSAVYQALPRPVQVFADVCGWVHGKIERGLESGIRIAQALVPKVAEARGLSTEHAEHVARICATADMVARWTGNVPLAHLGIDAAGIATGGAAVGLAKLAFYFPVGSAAYLAYSTARNPMATLRAARKLVKEGMPVKHAEDTHGYDEAAVARLLALFADAENPDWVEALVYAAMDITHDLNAAIDLAEKYADTPPGTQEFSEVQPPLTGTVEEYSEPAQRSPAAAVARSAQEQIDRFRLTQDLLDASMDAQNRMPNITIVNQLPETKVPVAQAPVVHFDPTIVVQPAPVKFAERPEGPVEMKIVSMPDRVTEVQRGKDGEIGGKVERDVEGEG